MTTTIIIAICSLLLLAYIFDITSNKTRIPSVILLLFLGWGVKQATVMLNVSLPDFSPLLPILGTLGLILIVLDGSLELELNKSKLGLIFKSFLGALLPIMALSFALAYMFSYFGNVSLTVGLINAVPLCVISSAIAIPSVRHLIPYHKEFVIYESSLSDIIGVLMFNFLAFNSSFDVNSFGEFGLQLLSMFIISLIAIASLSYLLHRIKQHIKFVPIILLVILIYTLAKVFHLPSLVFILLFGLFLGNICLLKRFKWTQRFQLQELEREVIKFKELTMEATFLVRALFFLLFGYLIETTEVFNPQTILWAVGIVVATLFIRFLQLKMSRLPLKPLLFIAPRGLITVLLFLSIDPSQQIFFVNKSLIIQVIVISAFLMMFGLIAIKEYKVNPDETIEKKNEDISEEKLSSLLSEEKEE
jgi:hypothetical protein